MAAVRGLSLEKIASVRMAFSVFDSKATSTRCTCAREQHFMVAFYVWPVRNVSIIVCDDNFCPLTMCREFMRRVTAAGVRESNMKCEVVHKVKGDQTSPTVHVTFSKCTCGIME